MPLRTAHLKRSHKHGCVEFPVTQSIKKAYVLEKAKPEPELKNRILVLLDRKWKKNVLLHRWKI